MRRMMIPMSAIASIFLLVISCAPTKKAKSKLIPDGIEYYTLLSGLVEPGVITTNGSDIFVNYETKTPIDLSEVDAVAVIIARGVTITTYGKANFFAPGKFRHPIYNPKITNPAATNYGKGELSGSGTIYVFLQRTVNGNRERVSNVLSVHATFR